MQVTVLGCDPDQSWSAKQLLAAAFHYRWMSATLPIAPLPATPFGLPLGGP